jgi:leader peptidase (prepilin peptidase)/N-methyltransferase
MLFMVLWAALGLALGFVVNRLSLRLEVHELTPWPDFKLRTNRLLSYLLPIGGALLFGAFAFKLHFGLGLLVTSIWVLVFLQIMVTDFAYRMILDWVVLPSALVAFLVAIFAPATLEVKDWGTDLLFGALALIFFLLLYFGPKLVMKVEAMGFGDVKLGLFIGLALGATAVNGIIYGIVLGGLVPGALLLLRLKKRGDYIPYGPFLCLGALAALLLRS